MITQVRHYKILHPIGKGGMGEVYLAQDTILDRKIAIKFLPQEFQDDVDSRERFFREAKAAAALDHPFICKVFETGEAEGKAYIAMEYVEGKNLDVLMQEDEIPLKDSVRFMLEITEALEKAHANDIVHRDLKPGNIMVTPQGRVKVMDFGLAKKVVQSDRVLSVESIAAAPEENQLLNSRDLNDQAKTVREAPAKQTDAAGYDDDQLKTVRESPSEPGQTGIPPGDDQMLTVREGPVSPEDRRDDIEFDPDKTIREVPGDDIPRIKPARFDLSKIGTDSYLTQQGSLVGTLAYMSPEQARGEHVDVRSDIFSLGIIFYEMVARNHPFLRASAKDTTTAILKEPPPEFKTQPKRILSMLTPVLNKMMAKDVGERYQSVTELTKDLLKVQKMVQLGARFLLMSKPAIAALLTIIAVITAGTFWLARKGRVSVAELNREPVTVLVADFRNETGDDVFEGAVEQALTIGLEGASFINIYQQPDARRSAREISPDFAGEIDEQMAQLISVREGIPKFVVGEIEPRGEDYTLSVRLLDSADPEDAREYSRKVGSKDDILKAAAWVANKVRSDLGDASADAKKALEGETFTTSSLAAMNAYTNAQDLYREGKDEESIKEYLRAIREDPDFGRAYSALAMVYRNRGQYEEGEQQFQEALARIDRMSEREKLRTRAVYYLMNRNFQQAIKECSELVQKYPADATGFSNLALAHFFARDYEQAKEMGRRAVDLNPRKIQTRFNLSWYALAASDFEIAAREAQTMIEDNPGFNEAYVVLALSYLAQGQVQEAARVYQDLAKIDPIGESLADLGLADIALYEGRLSDAVGIMEERLGIDRDQKRTDYLGNKWSLLARALLMRGEKAQAIGAAEQALASGDNIGIMFMSAHLYIQAGEVDRAVAVADELSRRLEPEPQAYAKLIEAEIERSKGQIQSAIPLFQQAQTILDTWIGRCLLGRAYLEVESYPDAHSALDSCFEKRGEAVSVFFDDTPTYHVVASIPYYLGRAQEGLGSPAAVESYRNYLAIKEKADWEDPLVKDARERIKDR